MLKVGVSGACGRMGKELVKLVMADAGLEPAGAFEVEGHPGLGKDIGEFHNLGAAGVAVSESLGDSKPDVVLDFSLPTGTLKRLAECSAAGAALVIGTTGLDDEITRQMEDAASRIPIIHATNFSLGVNVLWTLAEKAAEMLGETYEVEIIESHHHNKVDAPSGTAKTLLEKIAGGLGYDPVSDVIYGREGKTGKRPRRQIGVHALRQGLIVGEHTAIFASDTEIFELKHRCLDRATFAEGAIVAAKWLAGKPAGLFSMAEVLGLDG